MVFSLSSTRLTSPLGARAGFPAAAGLTAYRAPSRRNMTTEVFGTKIEKRTLYTGAAEGYFYYNTYCNASCSSAAQKTDAENKPVDNK
ncbi:hypothetical protein Unana1_08897 [Umbelopsis nana]